jgi:hypothetical protein
MRNNKDDWENEWVDPFRFEHSLRKVLKQYIDNNPDVKRYLKDNNLHVILEVVKND